MCNDNIAAAMRGESKSARDDGDGEVRRVVGSLEEEDALKGIRSNVCARVNTPVHNDNTADISGANTSAII